MTSKLACNLIRKLEGITEKDHFGSDAFIANKRMFATVWHDKNTANLRLSLKQQIHFLSQDGEAFVEIDNAWGRQGWTLVQLEFTSQDQFKEAIAAAFENSPNKASKLAGSAIKKTTKKKAKRANT
jgi:hypothetical protein